MFLRSSWVNAQPRFWLVYWQVVGIAVGCWRLLQSHLYEIDSGGIVGMFASATLVLGIFGVLAITMPAYRAMSVDPVVALRTE